MSWSQIHVAITLRKKIGFKYCGMYPGPDVLLVKNDRSRHTRWTFPTRLLNSSVCRYNWVIKVRKGPSVCVLITCKLKVCLLPFKWPEFLMGSPQIKEHVVVVFSLDNSTSARGHRNDKTLDAINGWKVTYTDVYCICSKERESCFCSSENTAVMFSP